MAAEGSWLDGFKGQRVTVLTLSHNEERTDTGTLVQLGDGWIQLSKDNGDMMLIPYSAVRIVKLLDMMQTVGGVDRGYTPNMAPNLDTLVYDPNAQTVTAGSVEV